MKRKMDALDSHKSKIKTKKIAKDNDKKQKIFRKSTNKNDN